MEGLVKDGTLKFGKNELMKVHLYDTALDSDTRNGRVKICKMRKEAHIDGVAAVLDALCVRQKWFSEIGSQLKNK